MKYRRSGSAGHEKNVSVCRMKSPIKISHLCFLVLLCVAPGSRAQGAPPYMVAGNRALGNAATAASFAYMPISNTLRSRGSDKLLCFYTASYNDRLLELFNLISDNLPEEPTAAEKERVKKIRAAAWKIKRGVLGLTFFCGTNHAWPPEWGIVNVAPGDRKAFSATVDRIEAALEELKGLIY